MRGRYWWAQVASTCACSCSRRRRRRPQAAAAAAAGGAADKKAENGTQGWGPRALLVGAGGLHLFQLRAQAGSCGSGGGGGGQDAGVGRGGAALMHSGGPGGACGRGAPLVCSCRHSLATAGAVREGKGSAGGGCGGWVRSNTVCSCRRSRTSAEVVRRIGKARGPVAAAGEDMASAEAGRQDGMWKGPAV